MRFLLSSDSGSFTLSHKKYNTSSFLNPVEDDASGYTYEPSRAGNAPSSSDGMRNRKRLHGFTLAARVKLGKFVENEAFDDGKPTPMTGTARNGSCTGAQAGL